MNKCCRICVLLGAVLGIVLIIVVAVLGFRVLPDVVYDQIEENVILNKGTEQYDRFEKLPFALNFSVYYFNVKNPDEVMWKGEKPIVEEIGPVTYSKAFEKKNIKFINEGNDIEFDQIKTHELVKAYSDYDEDYKITIVNTPLVSVMQIFEKFGIKLMNDILKRGYKVAFNLKKETIFHEIKLGDYAFNGYKFCNPEAMEAAVQSDKTKADDTTDEEKERKRILGSAKFICACIRLMAPESMEIDKKREISFSFFKQKDQRSDGRYVVQRGSEDITKVGNTVRWRGSDQTPFWLPATEEHDYHCNDVRGTDSTIYGPHNDKDSTFYIFNTDICRTVRLAYDSEIEYEGIPGYRSVLTKDNIDWSLPENKCYCIKQTKPLDWDGINDECLPSGFTDLYSCLDAPIVLSLPHFLWGDEHYASTVTGLEANEDKHKIFVDMEPNTGSPLRGHKRVQFNTILRRYRGIFDDANVNMLPSVMPILWIDEHVAIPENLVNLIKDQYLIPVTAIEISKWVLIAVGILMTIGFGGFFIFKGRSSGKYV